MDHAQIRAHEPVIAPVAEIRLGASVEILCHTPLHLQVAPTQEIHLTAGYEVGAEATGRVFGIRFESTLGEQLDRPHETRLGPDGPRRGTLIQRYDFLDPGTYRGEMRITVSEQRSGGTGRPGRAETVGIGSIDVEVL